MNQPWTPRPKPEKAERLERRIEFADYATTRDFLERLNTLSEDTQCFPDISFGRTYVNLTVRPESTEADALIGPEEEAFAGQIDGLLDGLALG
ncbi:MAG: 4a-hydroxytetrahydrobiopterin dehydratase [Cyanobacteriota bacterium]|jgi:4a-hydroxytetrahydrobiopterin dehydratase|nr:4a-hydroxytetrahydrobiopterin dehydratase [Synechococcus sp. FGCU3]MEB3104950.1 4a-hydroxytetrahydrobiopterin dehydratase [Cyanobacteriota bacterium]